MFFALTLFNKHLNDGIYKQLTEEEIKNSITSLEKIANNLDPQLLQTTLNIFLTQLEDCVKPLKMLNYDEKIKILEPLKAINDPKL